MNKIIKYLLTVVMLIIVFATSAQSLDGERFVVKARADIGLGNVINHNSSLPGMNTESSAQDYGIDFGWTFWKKNNHSLEANLGLAYSNSSATMSLSNWGYNYSAPAEADMDGESYIRYYELGNLHQKAQLGRISIPIYLTYAYRCNHWLGVHADFGVRIGFKTSSKLSSVNGDAYSYGVYPQYDNLKIEDNYLNDFGQNVLTTAQGLTPEANNFSASILVGVGAEFRIYGPLAADISLRYGGGLTNLYKATATDSKSFNATNAPITYTFNKGQRVNSLTNYLTSSKLSEFALSISLIYHF